MCPISAVQMLPFLRISQREFTSFFFAVFPFIQKIQELNDYPLNWKKAHSSPFVFSRHLWIQQPETAMIYSWQFIISKTVWA